MNKDSKHIENQLKILKQLDGSFSKLQNALKTKLNKSFVLNHKNLTLENQLSEEIVNLKEGLEKLQEKKNPDDNTTNAKYYKLYEEIMDERKKIKQDINQLVALKEDAFKNLKVEKERFDKKIKNDELSALEEFKHKLNKIVENIE
ncbi:unnamed protein product [Pneumocystis jirovecii]|uniref:Uncharacterized protein n=2 Tax=Pneumocystis jirovecii TaxID=42068 RepID=L0PGK6_PNEJI|nr:uncharacterized protein T551_01536 [Pneumocystis jirovecii RU7]KTW30984.1 hypothetical protein T551_01536 [Pneumocystis jirovecii RU7]CCJ30775.1 unnamed protein product [Pneumocystis jirovecii]